MRMQRIGVVGGGQMGAGIAEVCARSGADVVVVEADEAGLAAFGTRLRASLDRGLRAGRMTEAERDAARANISAGTDLLALEDRQLVVEAIVEDTEAKTTTFRRLDEIVKQEDAILTSNTSSIPIMRLATATSRPGAVAGLHFFNPVPVLRLVELVPSLLTSPSTLERIEGFAAEQLGRIVIRSQDRAGFVVNALLVPYILSAIRMLESGFASAADIDLGMVEGCAHPMGPLHLADLIGLDTLLAVANSLYDEFKEPLYAGPPLLLRMVEAGLLGRKTGRGFFDYAR